jgi:hypothetical protein
MKNMNLAQTGGRKRKQARAFKTALVLSLQTVQETPPLVL